MKLKLILKMLPVESILALESATNQNVMKKPCFEFLSRVLTFTLTLTRWIRFSATVWFFPILGHFLLIWEPVSKFIWLCIKFSVKSSIVLLPGCSSAANLPVFFLKFLKRARKLRVKSNFLVIGKGPTDDIKHSQYSREQV